MDSPEIIAEAVRQARAEGRHLATTGHASKQAWLPAPQEAELFSLTEFSGICRYQPEELVVTARAGTPLKTLTQTLAQKHQRLAFEPPLFRGAGTVGGMVASGLSGPSRPWCGSVRDAVLGVQMINGLGEVLRFGGEVMKNVAGYDVSRLQAGAFGALGALLEISLRVQPAYAHEVTLRFELTQDEAQQQMTRWLRQSWPISASCWWQDQLWIRLSGVESAVQHAQDHLGGEPEKDVGFWQRIRDHEFVFFKPVDQHVRPESQQLWRVVVPTAAPKFPEADQLVEWGGGLRWVWLDDGNELARWAADCGGWVWRLGGPQPLDELQQRYMGRLKAAFDPDGVFVSALSLAH